MSRYEELEATERALKAIVDAVAKRRADLIAEREALREDVLRHGHDNPAQKKQWQRDIAHCDIRLEEVEHYRRRLLILGIDTRPAIEARRAS